MPQSYTGFCTDKGPMAGQAWEPMHQWGPNDRTSLRAKSPKDLQLSVLNQCMKQRRESGRNHLNLLLSEISKQKWYIIVYGILCVIIISPHMDFAWICLFEHFMCFCEFRSAQEWITFSNKLTTSTGIKKVDTVDGTSYIDHIIVALWLQYFRYMLRWNRSQLHYEFSSPQLVSSREW